MNTDLRATLIFINWRTPDLTLAAVRSARERVAEAEGLQVIVVDNGSGDGSVDRLRRGLGDAEIVDLPENRGFAAAVNAGLQRARAPFSLILNSDIEFDNDAVAVLTEALEQDPKAALACPKLLRPDGTIQAAAVPEPRLFWELTNRSLARRTIRLHESRPTPVASVVGPCMAVHMERLQHVGGLDERFFFFFEETDWCRRMRQAGFRLLYVPQASVVHLQGESANRRPIRARVQFYQSRYKYFRKHGGPVAVGVLYAGLMLRLTVSVLSQALLSVLTCGRRRHRDKCVVYAVLWYWHVLGCRPRWGFEN